MAVMPAVIAVLLYHSAKDTGNYYNVVRTGRWEMAVIILVTAIMLALCGMNNRTQFSDVSTG